MPRIVLLPGLDGTGELFAPFVAKAPEGWRTQVVRYPPDAPLGYDGCVEVARAALSESSGYLLLGESFSGPVALRLAVEEPPGLRGVILCNSFARRPWWSGFRALPWRTILARPMPRRVARALLGSEYGSSELADALRAAVASVRPEALARRVREVLTVDATDALEAISVPTLYLRGSKDRLVRKRSLRSIQACRADVQVTTLPASHLLLQTHPAEAWDAIARFAANTTR